MIRALIIALALAACVSDGTPDPTPYPSCDDLGCESLSCDEFEPVCTCGIGDEFTTCDNTPTE